MLQRFCLWKWLAVGIAVATILAGCLAQNDEGNIVTLIQKDIFDPDNTEFRLNTDF